MFGETIERVLDSYLEDENQKTALKVYNEAENLLALDDDKLIKEFAAIFQGGFYPEPWG
ncbi:contact-dependent growth inhibition system immunity protein [Erwinia piriflorinigrans]|uniref:CdiI immunity protein domain-containing protein n=1 Tax=Erwinia piriflorinigrans CFBP 5888 TaxID=1161919 RepID=V5Z3G9_9GAMM|nr:contact-dependent growth inhibition system immunity protein [Erwinia piriflorinigrans]CCG85870.1 hypothetical protein EPIR_0505 [Erwinia piriflorinigrans CFBP 5888]